MPSVFGPKTVNYAAYNEAQKLFRPTTTRDAGAFSLEDKKAYICAGKSSTG